MVEAAAIGGALMVFADFIGRTIVWPYQIPAGVAVSRSRHTERSLSEPGRQRPAMPFVGGSLSAFFQAPIAS
jgi:hypothetical protein